MYKGGIVEWNEDLTLSILNWSLRLLFKTTLLELVGALC